MKRNNFSSLLNLQEWGARVLKLVLTYYFLKILLSAYKNIVYTQIFTLKEIEYIILITLVFGLNFCWIWITGWELRIIINWVKAENYEPPSGIRELVIVLALLIVMGSLLYAAKYNIFYFSIVFFIYSLANDLVLRYFNKELSLAINKGETQFKGLLKTQPEKTNFLNHQLEGLNILKRYYFSRPQVGRYDFFVIFSFIGLICSLVWRIKGQFVWAVISYAIPILTILILESLILYWRSVRDNELRIVRMKIRDIGETPPEDPLYFKTPDVLSSISKAFNKST